MIAGGLQGNNNKTWRARGVRLGLTETVAANPFALWAR
jgi:hypothetical protein